jgi:hypothetical protein
MRRSSTFLTLTLALGTLGTIATTGCAEHRYRVYDSYHTDYHNWNADEDRHYRSWLGERHYDYVEFKAQNPDRQKEYWNWRHEHHDNDHDRDHDRDHDKH